MFKRRSERWERSGGGRLKWWTTFKQPKHNANAKCGGKLHTPVSSCSKTKVSSCWWFVFFVRRRLLCYVSLSEVLEGWQQGGSAFLKVTLFFFFLTITRDQRWRKEEGREEDMSVSKRQAGWGGDSCSLKSHFSWVVRCQSSAMTNCLHCHNDKVQCVQPNTLYILIQ